MSENTHVTLRIALLVSLLVGLGWAGAYSDAARFASKQSVCVSEAKP